MRRSWILVFAATLAYGQGVVIRTSTLLDGKGHVLKNTDLAIEGGRITRVGKASGKAAIDLTGMTVMPGWIDTHVHATWYFNQDGRLEQGGRGSKSTPQQAALYAAANLYATLMGGFTTVQSVGAELDGDLRAQIAAGAIAGPRLLTSLRQINENTGTPERIREYVRKMKADGADVVKLFATASIRDGGKMTMTPEQITAACGEAKAQGLRSVVHAHSSDGRAGRGDGGLHVDRARHVSGRRHAGIDGAARRLLRPELSGAAQLPGQ